LTKLKNSIPFVFQDAKLKFGSKMFAVIKTGGKQYVAVAGKVLFIEKIEGEIGSIINFDGENVLFGFDNKSSTNLTVKAEILEHKKRDKIIVFKKKRRKDYRRKQGHRQMISVLRIKEIIS
jgi:large subunit ribosomal protein L21